MRILFQSTEQIEARHPRAKECVTYNAILRVRDSGTKPVSLELTFVPPHPFFMNLPESHTIKAQTITLAYASLTRFLARFGFEFGR